MFRRIISVFFISFACLAAFAQQVSVVKEYKKEYLTYPYSDPNPIPVFGKIYPYYRFDGYTTKGEKRLWKIVELENDYLRIKIFPEIGGKIWSVFDKVAGKEMFYDNEVVKFRDISLRGPWTSGGIEFNYGVVGHSPGCSFPVDYLTRTNEDGSVSCIIGMLDLLTRTRWHVEINLPKDKRWFTTNSFWHNATASAQPYYNWVNTGVAAKEDLEFTYPGTHVIRHDGIVFPWPMDKERNKNLSIWAENNFIGSKSYHITGSHRPYFGAYWRDDDFGMMQYATRDNKIGKKIFSWALSDQGKIWEDLLTDRSGQYVELQSGRLFNQNMVISSHTPYKQIQFAPYATDVWNEYWFPYHGTGGVSDASLYGVTKIEKVLDGLLLKISPLQFVNEALKVYDPEGNLLYEERINLSPAIPFTRKIRLEDQKAHRITLAYTVLWSEEDQYLERPVETVPDFNRESAYGNYLQGRDLAGLRLYDQAETHIRKALALDPHFIPALAEMASLYDYRMRYDSAFICAQKALSIDQYDPRSNYEYGRAAKRLGKFYDALDGFEVATLTTPLRSAAFTELSKLYFSRQQLDKAAEYAKKSLVNNAYNLEGLQVSYLCEPDVNTELLEQIRKLDPLHPFPAFERYFAERSETAKNAFLQSMTCEFPSQSCLELAILYHTLGLEERSREILQLSPVQDGEMLYWLAYLYRNTDRSAHYLMLADQSDPSFVFPFREECKEVFEWADSVSTSWKPTYCLALLHGFRNNAEHAIQLLYALEDTPDFPPFYVLRASCGKEETKEADLLKAMQLDPLGWRYVHSLTRHYIGKKEYEKALKTIEPFYTKNRDHFQTGSLYAKVLICNREYTKADKVLSETHILPFEGERGGRLLYQEIKLMLAIQSLEKGRVKQARKKIEESFLWPRNIGTGKPYEENIDNRLEHWLLAMTWLKAGDLSLAQDYYRKTAESIHSKTSVYALLQALALHKLGKSEEATTLYTAWYGAQRTDNIREWGKAFFTHNKDKDYPFDYENLARMIGLISGTEDMRLF